jgi:DNA primase
MALQDFIFYKTNILLKDTGGDPIKRAEVIREVVESIALIPDEIKVSVFIQQCSHLLDIEERVLLTELNKIRLQKAKAQDKKVQQAFKTSNEVAPADIPPADLFLTDAERVQEVSSGGETPQAITSDTLQEREIVRILLNYGEELAAWEGDGDIPIAPLLLNALDDIAFEDRASAFIVDVFKQKAQHFEIPDAKYFFSHEDKEVQDLAITCVATPYELSPNWNDEKRKIYVRQEWEQLRELTMQAIYRIKKRKVEKEMVKIREELKVTSTEEDMEILLAKYQKLKEAEKVLGNFLGNIVVK